MPNVITLKVLKVGLNCSDMVEVHFVQFDKAIADNNNLKIKADGGCFLFFNLYITYGKCMV
jgi:hypothetical protein